MGMATYRSIGVRGAKPILKHVFDSLAPGSNMVHSELMEEVITVGHVRYNDDDGVMKTDFAKN